jgi:hypothetical protein
VIALGPVVDALKLPQDAGAVVSGHRPGLEQAEVNPAG